jgi:CRISPR-associated endonuclease/helicase Cas3
MLLAKSVRNGQPPKYLPAHTNDVLSAATALFGRDEAPTDLAISWLRFFRLDLRLFSKLLRHVTVGTILHDVGKANDGAQDLFAHRGEQAVYHEQLSGLLVGDAEVQRWLERAGLDADLLLAAVLGHHLRVGHKTLLQLLPVGRSVVRLLTDDDDFADVWRELAKQAEQHEPPPLSIRKRWTANDLGARASELQRRLQKFNSQLSEDADRRRLLRAVRSALIVADSAGSAVVRLPGDKPSEINDALRVATWVQSWFSDSLTPGYIRDSIIAPRIKQLGGRFKNFNEFQRGIPDQPSRLLLTAPCASGKTLAAWKWIEGQVGKYRASRAIFIYPTRATATEGFRDYVSWAPEAEASLVSGTADYELQGMFESPDDPRTGRDYRTDSRLYALGLWSKRVFSATADQFLPFLQYGYGQICLLPILAESVLVVDEVHSFDESMFATLKRFLKEFDIPVLCMTATLPEERRRDLVDGCGLKPYPEAPPSDLILIAEHSRYQVKWIDEAEADAIARSWLAKKARVLRVVNRVDDCRATYRELAGSPEGWAAFCYHSRYRLGDRRDRHRDLILNFQEAARDATPRAILGVTTQVCELSLDLDADVLITDLAPISSLIQRMGRCGRDNGRVLLEGRIGFVYIVRRQSGREKPYELADLEAAERFVDAIADRDVSQAELERVFRQYDNHVVEPDRLCPFLDSGAYAQSGEESFRDIEELTVPCVLDGDVDEVLQLLHQRSPIDGFIVPVPRRGVAADLRPGNASFPRWLSVARSANYDNLTGFGTD